MLYTYDAELLNDHICNIHHPHISIGHNVAGQLRFIANRN